MREGVVIDVVPGFTDKGADQKKQCALRLVEVRYHAADNVVFVARGNDNLRAGVQHFLTSLVHVAK